MVGFLLFGVFCGVLFLCFLGFLFAFWGFCLPFGFFCLLFRGFVCLPFFCFCFFGGLFFGFSFWGRTRTFICQAVFRTENISARGFDKFSSDHATVMFSKATWSGSINSTGLKPFAPVIIQWVINSIFSSFIL